MLDAVSYSVVRNSAPLSYVAQLDTEELSVGRRCHFSSIVLGRGRVSLTQSAHGTHNGSVGSMMGCVITCIAMMGCSRQQLGKLHLTRHVTQLVSREVTRARAMSSCSVNRRPVTKITSRKFTTQLRWRARDRVRHPPRASPPLAPSPFLPQTAV